MAQKILVRVRITVGAVGLSDAGVSREWVTLFRRMEREKFLGLLVGPC